MRFRLRKMLGLVFVFLFIVAATCIAEEQKMITGGGLTFKILSVSIGKNFKGMAPYNPTPKPGNDAVLIVELELVQGDPGKVADLDSWILNDQGERNDPNDQTAMLNNKRYTLLFNVPKSSSKITLVIGGDNIDLSPYLTQDKKTGFVIRDKNFEDGVDGQSILDLYTEKGSFKAKATEGVGTFAIANGKMVFFGYGSVHRWIGENKYAGYTFKSDKDDPLVFEVIKGEGYVYQKGKGIVIDPKGKKTQLPL